MEVIFGARPGTALSVRTDRAWRMQMSRYVDYLHEHPMPAVLAEPLLSTLQALGDVTPLWWLRALLTCADTWCAGWGWRLSREGRPTGFKLRVLSLCLVAHLFEAAGKSLFVSS